MKIENPLNRFVVPVARTAAILGGYAVLLLAFAVTTEIFARRFFRISLQGVDDIGGYVLAITVAIGISYTMAMRGHTRIDVLMQFFPPLLRRLVNVVAAVSLALFALYAVWRCWIVLAESIEFQSVATNPLQTPLWIPQGVWLAGLGLFALFATLFAVHALWLFVRGRPELDLWYGPPGTQEEVLAELELRRALAEKAGERAP